MREVLVVQHPLIASLLTQMRDKETPTRNFRANLHTIGSLLIYEATRGLLSMNQLVHTPMGEAIGSDLVDEVGFFPILRAGLGFIEAGLALYPDAPVWHLGMYRDELTLEPVGYYNKINGSLDNIDVGIILDPMLATGGSGLAATQILKNAGITRIIFVALLAAPEGIEALQNAHPDVQIVVAAVDKHLNDIGFIVPGLGDAGDRQFGTH